MTNTIPSARLAKGNTNFIKIDDCPVEIPAEPADCFNLIRSLIITSYRAVISGTSSPVQSALIFGTAATNRTISDKSDVASHQNASIDVTTNTTSEETLTMNPKASPETRVDTRSEEGPNAKNEGKPSTTTEPIPDGASGTTPDTTQLGTKISLWEIAIALDAEIPSGVSASDCGPITLYPTSTVRDVAIAIGAAAGRPGQPGTKTRPAHPPPPAANEARADNIGQARGLEQNPTSSAGPTKRTQASTPVGDSMAWPKQRIQTRKGAYTEGQTKLSGELACAAVKLGKCGTCRRGGRGIICNVIVDRNKHFTTTICGKRLESGHL